MNILKQSVPRVLCRNLSAKQQETYTVGRGELGYKRPLNVAGRPFPFWKGDACGRSNEGEEEAFAKRGAGRKTYCNGPPVP